MQRLEMTARFFIQRLEQSGISEQRRQPVSEIDYQALREAAERAIPAMERLLMLPVDDDLLSEQELKDYGVDIDALNAFKFLAGPETVLALLDEINALEETRINDVCRIAELTKQLESAKSKLNEQREYYEGVISDGSKRIAELESNEVREDGNQFLVVRHPGKTPVIKHCTGDLEEFLRKLIEQDPLVTIDIITHRYYGIGGQWVQDAVEYLHMMSDAGIRIKGE
ncbi:TPA: ead/Ea22-like family protein [Escherichia coli]